MIYCTRKTEKLKLNIHNQAKVWSFRNYSLYIFKDALNRVRFPNYSLFTNVDIAYSVFLEKLSLVIDSIAPLKEKRIKMNLQDWFNGEIAEQIRTRKKSFKVFKHSKLHLDDFIFKEQRNYVQSLIRDKKQEFYKEKQIVEKTKELWKTRKSLGLPSKSSSRTKTCLNQDGIKHFDDKSNVTYFKDFSCDLANNLVSKLFQVHPKIFACHL